jgi:signal transduction histidine kinase
MTLVKDLSFVYPRNGASRCAYVWGSRAGRASTTYSPTGLAPTLFLLLIFLSAGAQGQSHQVSEPDVIDTVDFLYSEAFDPPPSSAAWRPMQLPFNTREDMSQMGTSDQEAPYIWFRFTLDQPPAPGRYSLYFWRFNLALNVYLNNIEIGGSVHRDDRTTMSWNRPLLTEIQPQSWQEGQNEILVRLTRSKWGGNFAPVLFGDHNHLQALWSERVSRQVEINEILLAFGLGLTLINLVIWAARPRDNIYLWFGGMSFSWSLVTMHMVIYHNPLPYDVWLPLVHVGIDGSIFCMYGFIGRLVEGVRRAGREHLFLIWTLLASGSHFLVPPDYFWISTYSIHMAGTLWVGAIVIRVARLALRDHNRQAIIVSLAILLQILLFFHNAYLMFFATSERWEGNMFYAHFGIPLLFLIFTGILISRFTQALAVAETLNRELEDKVEESRQLIEQTFAERRALEIKQAAEQERLKIYRDLHDDVGSKLLSIVHADRGSGLGNMARAALESLRNAVSKANNPDQALESFLHDIREETELRLMGSGHQIIWQQTMPVPTFIIPSTVAFNLNRILKEVVSNIIRHARADHVNVTIKLSDDLWTFEVTDNGQGLEEHAPRGNGINNIESRTQEINASVKWHSQTQTGTRFVLQIPAIGGTESIQEVPSALL